MKRCSPITGREEFYYPPWRRRLFRWLVSLPVCVLCICFVFLVMLICFELQVSHGEREGLTRYLCCGSAAAVAIIPNHSLQKHAPPVPLQEFVMGIKEMPRLARFIPKIMLAITVTACDEVYRKIACWLNDMGESPAPRFRPRKSL